MSPSNDFHSKVQDIPQAVSDIKSSQWRVVSSPNRNHGDSAEYSVGTTLWFDQFLKGQFKMAETPTTKLTLKTADQIPSATVAPDRSQKVISVDVYYTQDGGKDPKEKFWRLAKPIQGDAAMTFQLPLVSTTKPLWVYADVQYALGRTVEAVGYSGEAVKTDSYHLASVVEMVNSEKLQAAGVKATIDESVVAEDFNTYQSGKNLEKQFPSIGFNEGITCVSDPGSRPGMSIKMQDSPDFQYAWMPLLTVNTTRASFIGTTRWEFTSDVMLDAGKPVPLIVEFRTKDRKKSCAPLMVDDKGNVSVRGKKVIKLCNVTPGKWWNFSATYDLNNAETFQITIKDADGLVLANNEIEIQSDMGAVNWIGFIPHGNAAGSLYVDNVKLQQLESKPKKQAEKKPQAIRIAPTTKNIKYGSHKKELMNFWQVESKQPAGVLLDIHGGGWMGGKKAETMHKNHLNPNYHYASVSYPLVNEGAVQPAMLDAALRAVQFLRHNAKKWNIDPNRIVVSGGSAGGCSSLLVALHDDVADPNSKDPVERMSSRVAGACVAGAQTTMNPFVIQDRIGEQTFGNPMPYKPFGAETAQDLMANWDTYKDLVLECSPVSHVSERRSAIAFVLQRQPRVPNDPSHPTAFTAPSSAKFCSRPARKSEWNVICNTGRKTNQNQPLADNSFSMRCC